MANLRLSKYSSPPGFVSSPVSGLHSFCNLQMLTLSSSLVKIMQSTPEQQTGFGTLQLIEKFKIAAEFDVKAPFLALLKADVCFCIYRTLRSCSSTNTNLAAPQVTSLLEVIQVASDSVKFLTAMHHPWFPRPGDRVGRVQRDTQTKEYESWPARSRIP